MLLFLLLLLAACLLTAGQPPCAYSLLLNAGGDLPAQPLALPTDVAADAQACAFACVADGDCAGFNFLAGGATCSQLPACPHASGCCWLKRNASSSDSMLNKMVGGCSSACSFIVRAAGTPPAPPPPAPPPPGAKNVLYVLVDDMRPDAAPWGAGFMSTPALAALARSSTVFSRAYCNIAVCSPSRQSFLTGRYPHTLGIYNFLNHFRQSTCAEVPDASFGAPGSAGSFKTTFVADGGAGQCCSDCTSAPACKAWSFAPKGFNGSSSFGQCTLFDAPAAAPARAQGHYAGVRGSARTRDFVTLPQTFVAAGYLTLQTGKVFHTEEGGSGPAPWDAPGSGMPPLQDPPSWSRANGSMANVNAVAPMRPCEATCSIAGNAAGDVADPRTTFRFCDRIIGDDAVLRLRQAAANRAASGQPFFLAVGFRKPHLPFRHPSYYDALYPAPADVPLAAHKTLPPGVPPVAFHQTSLAADPYAPLPDAEAGTLRRDYYASISWTDSQIGRVLDELRAQGLEKETAVVFHADHGFSLGESGEWEKFSVWEAGTRVPLLIRAPWLAAGGGVSGEIAELVDVFPTITDLAGLPTPPGLDGASLVPALLRAAAGAPPPPPPPPSPRAALSVYPRCPANTVNASLFWRNNDCLLVERVDFLIMAISLRTAQWRYSEYRWWLGAALAPDWARPPVATELYDHRDDTGNATTTYDAHEVVNLALDPAFANVSAALAGELRAAYGRAENVQ
jgi:iduronate 2-sulfatase